MLPESFPPAFAAPAREKDTKWRYPLSRFHVFCLNWTLPGRAEILQNPRKISKRFPVAVFPRPREKSPKSLRKLSGATPKRSNSFKKVPKKSCRQVFLAPFWALKSTKNDPKTGQNFRRVSRAKKRLFMSLLENLIYLLFVNFLYLIIKLSLSF